MPAAIRARSYKKSEGSYIDLMVQYEQYTRQACLAIWDKSNDWWDLFLALQEDKRDPIDESWRSNVFVPLPFTTTRTKAAQITELLGNTEPVWQVQAAREDTQWYEKSREYQRLLEYTHRMNRWRKFLYKMMTARSVQGTAFMKAVWMKRAHTVTLFANPSQLAQHEAAVQAAVSQGAPTPPDRMLAPAAFEQWRTLVNTTQRLGFIPAVSEDGPKEIIEYEGPVFQYVPLWAMRVDPMIDEIHDQKIIIHRMVKSAQYVIDRASNDPNDPTKPYDLDAVMDAMQGWDGQVLEQQQRELAESLGLNPQEGSHPLLGGTLFGDQSGINRTGVELYECWSPDEPYKYSIVMNRRRIINKRAEEFPLLTTTPNVFAIRNVMVPGHFFGLSDYQEPERLFQELNSFRRIRMDGATLTTLPAFVKTAGWQLSETMKKIKPGMIITVPAQAKDAITSLIKHQLPPEAYREPAEIKQEIEDATEVYNSTKGAPATIGRVTGTEYQGRAGQTLLKYKVDASLIEEELSALPSVILSMYAQMADAGRVIRTVAGDPNAMVDVSQSDLVEAINMRFRMRGATKNLNPDMEVQQLTKAMADMRDVITPAERRFGLQLIMELLDIRGYSKVLTEAGTAQFTGVQDATMGATVAGANAQADQANAIGVKVPGSISQGAARSMPQPATPPTGAAPPGGQGGGKPTAPTTGAPGPGSHGAFIKR